ncbi:bifunctional phosphopantothenoylcysteine decarboxylase/phosphopantothenate--cysteine ligase CoaBC [Dokdonella koreensis]|uniref:Coenzyme A biosynthesis bifunctional protein CoaBC n=1 Tax=Dokdonella koreensis DS-123 TaxID=1300342 RepID=A0A160DXJ6_9GAMM|nr:bifunctional phosphopantothenoylcysteine decarboxylase/phosphopantothenate--cysteine ligase CoaBC [Dokdonella koreensis]ANB19437.1 Bifunctional phosphopantothenoylcysteine decarboxylase/phosphopantothenate synthase [Dokdonella koreensis DS-123]
MTSASLAKRRILLGVSGGVAAYKAAYLVRRLGEAGAEVQVVLTENAARFVTALTFQALSGRPVRTSLWDEAAEAAMGHIELARWADQIVVAPASADLIARLAHGHADDLLTTLCLASAAPIALAPAMNQQMWAQPVTQANLSLLRGRGMQVIGPGVGDQACGDVGAGRMSEPEDIVAALAPGGRGSLLAGKRVLVDAGPTHEPIDPVRFIGNRSSGRMGFAVAAAAAAQGAEVVLVAGPVALATPAGVRRVDVRSAAEMHTAVLAEAGAADIFIATAAVADYRPETVSPSKLKKTGGAIELKLVQNADILADVAALPGRPFVVGFAAETDNVEGYARGKLERKNLDMIAANRVADNIGFECAENALLLLWDGGREELERADKQVLAARLIERIAERYRPRGG